jgi:Phenylalanyl-tRNA synthetase beta subunit
LITDVSIFDAYVGPNVDTGKKSLAVRFRMEPRDTTLTDEDIAALFDKIVKNVHTTTGGVLRDGKV